MFAVTQDLHTIASIIYRMQSGSSSMSVRTTSCATLVQGIAMTSRNEKCGENTDLAARIAVPKLILILCSASGYWSTSLYGYQIKFPSAPLCSAPEASKARIASMQSKLSSAAAPKPLDVPGSAVIDRGINGFTWNIIYYSYIGIVLKNRHIFTLTAHHTHTHMNCIHECIDQHLWDSS